MSTPADYVYTRRYRGSVQALVLDWSGTTADAYVIAPAVVPLGFETLLPDELQAPIIVTFHTPSDPAFDFKTFYDGLRQRGYVIYPGKLTVADSFRIGCIGHVFETDIRGALAAVEEVLTEMGVDNRGRARAA